MTGIVFDIKEFALHDGPGPRTTVFLKGCPLRCRWCHNPEGLSPQPQLLVKQALCVGCGRCRRGCAHPECAPFDRCLHACPNGAISLCGQSVEAEALAQKLKRDAAFFASSGGGITVSGGEPLLQAAFVQELCAHLGNDIHKTLETSGCAAPQTFQSTVKLFDLVLFDLKLADAAAHSEWTGADNTQILANLAWLRTAGIPFILRIPLIPGITDTRENLSALAAIAGNDPVELLAYNALAGAKYPMAGREWSLGDRTANPAEQFLSLFQNARVG